MRFRPSLAAAFLAVLSPLALAGESCRECQNACPLARDANERRSGGDEAVLASKIVQRHEIARVVRNLARI
jgi:hypothetical protein